MSVAQLIADCRAMSKEYAFYRTYGCNPHEPKKFVDELASKSIASVRYNPFSGDFFVRLESAKAGKPNEDHPATVVRLSLPRLMAVTKELESRAEQNGELNPNEVAAQKFVYTAFRCIFRREAPGLDTSKVKASKLSQLTPIFIALRKGADRKSNPSSNTFVKYARYCVRTCSR